MASQPSYTPGTFFSLLDDREREGLAELGRERRFARGAVLFYEREPGDHVIVLLSGRAKATRMSLDGREALLSIRDPGDILGELSFIDGAPRAAEVVALEPVRSLVVPSAAFRAHLECTPRVAVVLLEVLTLRFRDTIARLAQFGASDTIGRLAARLLELADRYGRQTTDGLEFEMALSREELGAWTGASRAGLAKALQTVRELGWVETHGRRVILRDPDALRARAA